MDLYLISIVSIGIIYSLLCLSLHLTWGQMGVVNLGITAFFGIGGYSTAILSTAYDVPISLSILIGFALSGLAGAGICRLTSHLQDDYLAITTLGFSEIMRIICLNEIWLTNGSDGISGVPSPFNRALREVFAWQYLGFLCFFAVVVLFVFFRIGRAPLGRLLRSIRDDQVTVSAAGKNVEKIKIIIFSISTAVAGLAGALYVHYTSYVSPEIFQPLLTIYIFLGVCMGGRSSTWGSFCGGFLVIGLLEATRFLETILPGFSGVQQTAAREILIALVFIAVLINRPNGLSSVGHQFLEYFSRRQAK